MRPGILDIVVLRITGRALVLVLAGLAMEGKIPWFCNLLTISRLREPGWRAAQTGRGSAHLYNRLVITLYLLVSIRIWE